MVRVRPEVAPEVRSQRVDRPNPNWRETLADMVTDPRELCRLVGVPESETTPNEFATLVSRTFLSRIQPGQPDDPLLAQVLPRTQERLAAPRFTTNPVGEDQAAQTCGLLRKYQNRALIVATDACAVHCRFCFRRHFRHARTAIPPECWEPALAHIAADPTIGEVILSGGDPLILEDGLLDHLVHQLARLPHVRRLRVHTRVPVMIPQRVTDDLLAALRATRLVPILVVHVNHPAEIDDSVVTALERLIDAGVPVLSQSVLLRGVNDEVEVLARLFERLVDLRVIPYYLHQLDRVAGAAHFEVPESTGITLTRQLRARLPGYAVPRYVREVPGRPNKVVLA